MECKFVVGQKVVCIVDKVNWVVPDPRIIDPVRNQIYTVREIRAGIFNKKINPIEAIGIRLIEIDNSGWDREEPYFEHTCFRPLDTRSTETGMKILQGILDDENHKDLIRI